jgi:hemerythrin-like metal-binding protein
MFNFSWSDNLYSVKVFRFDDAHKKLFSIMAKFNDAVQAFKGQKVLKDVLEELLEYTKTHFSDEEELMQRHGYTGIYEQQIQHKAFIDKVQDYINKQGSGELVLSNEVMDFLEKWLINHIQQIDKKYSDFFNAKGIS